MQSMAERYKCNGCATGQTPEGIHAGPNGIRKSDPKDALKEEQVSQTETPAPAPIEDPPVYCEESAVEVEPAVEPKRVARRSYRKRRRF